MAGELITGDGQLEYNGYLLGDDVTTFMVNLTGWDDLPPIDSSNTLRPASHGAWTGKKLAGQRILTWTGRFAPETDWVASLSALQRAFTIPMGTEELEIVVRTRTETKLVYGTVSARAIPVDYSYSYYGAQVTLQFECGDPRKYSLGEISQSISMPTPIVDGLDYPLVYPLDYGIAQQTADATIVNEGDAEAPIILNFSGPVVNPKLFNNTTGEYLGFGITLTSDDILTVNTRTGTVVINSGADRLYTRDLASSPIMSFNLAPGNNEFHMTAASWSTGAGVEIIYRSASF